MKDNFFYGSGKYRRLISEMPEEKLVNPDGTFNKDCLSYEDFCRDWVPGTYYEQEELACFRKGVYENTMKRLHLRYRYIVGDI